MAESFEAMGLNAKLLRGIHGYGMKTPSDLQQRAIPIIAGGMAGRKAHEWARIAYMTRQRYHHPGTTRSGQEGDICHPHAQKIDTSLKATQAVILVPTRELAIQIKDDVVAISGDTGISSHACIGGVSIRDDTKALQDGTQTVVGTPGRVQDMISRGLLKTDSIKMAVLDEADELLSRGFTDQIYEIFERLAPSTQVVSLSDTVPEAVYKVANKLMRNPQRVSSKQDTTPAFESVKHFYIAVEKEAEKSEAVADLYEAASTTQAIIYCTTRAKAESLTKNLASRGMTVLTVHGELEHDQRDAAISEFCSGSSPILVTTDGYRINGEQVSLVINYDLPPEREDYFKRLDRAGVSPGKRVVINLVTSGDKQMINAIEEFYKIKIQEMPMNVADLI